MVLHHATHSDNKPSDGRQRFVAKQVVENQFEPWHNEHEEKTQDAHGHCHHDYRIDHCRYDFVSDLGGLLLKFREPGEHELKHAADLAGLHHVDVQIAKNPRMQGQCVRKHATPLDGIGEFVDGIFH